MKTHELITLETRIIARFNTNILFGKMLFVGFFTASILFFTQNMGKEALSLLNFIFGGLFLLFAVVGLFNSIMLKNTCSVKIKEARGYYNEGISIDEACQKLVILQRYC